MSTKLLYKLKFTLYENSVYKLGNILKDDTNHLLYNHECDVIDELKRIKDKTCDQPHQQLFGWSSYAWLWYTWNGLCFKLVHKTANYLYKVEIKEVLLVAMGSVWLFDRTNTAMIKLTQSVLMSQHYGRLPNASGWSNVNLTLDHSSCRWLILSAVRLCKLDGTEIDWNSYLAQFLLINKK